MSKVSSAKMSQQNKFFLFLAVCCYVIQVISCVKETSTESSSNTATDAPKYSFKSLPQVSNFRPNFLPRRSLSSNFRSGSTLSAEQLNVPSQQVKPGSGLPVFRFNRSFSKLEKGSDDKQDAQAQIPIELTASSASQVPEETSGNGAKTLAKTEKGALKKSQMKQIIEQTSNRVEADEESSSEKPVDRSLSRQNSEINDPFYIADRESLKERAKDLLRNLLRENNANTAVSHISHNVSELLKNKVFSQIVKTHLGLIKNTLTNEEAKKIIENIEVRTAMAFINENAPAKTQVIFSDCLQHLANKNLPKFYEEQFIQLSNMINSKQVRYAAGAITDGFVKFAKSKSSAEKIEKFFINADRLLNMNFTNFWELVKGGK